MRVISLWKVERPLFENYLVSLIDLAWKIPGTN